MAEYTYSSDIVLSELLYIASNIVWKNPKLSLAGESGDRSIEIEQYNLARQGRLTFDMVYSFDEQPLIDAGVPAELISSCLDDIYSVPNQYREVATRLQQEYIIKNYVEQNNYYRMLAGLPDLEDTNFFYNTKYPEISGTTVPIHLLSQEQLFYLENAGYIDELIKANPSKKYLTHLTSKKIDVYVARNSPDYGLLYIPHSDLSDLTETFRDQYESCRSMISTVYKIRNLSAENTEYHGFIGLTILFATINLMHQKFLDADITRDFFDEESLRYVYDSYMVPFYSKIPIQFHKKIVKNINRLISLKGSTQCIYELFDIFGFSSVDIYEYYMIKLHKFNAKGKPVFAKKEDGSYDYEKMFDVKFAKCRLYDDPPSEIAKTTNHVGYRTLTDPDPYWIHDKRLVELIYQSEYNYVDSKYLGIQTMFEMMRIIYEGSFYIKLILDNRSKLAGTTIYYKNIRANCNIFDFIIYICCIMSKKNDLAGNIAEYPHEIGKFLGFNFKEDLSIVRDNVSKNDYLKNDTKLLDLLSSVNLNSLESVTQLYSNIVKLRVYLTNKMHDTHDRDTYFAYYELYNMLMYSEYVDDIFTKSDGTKAATFEELLKDINPLLYERYIDPTKYDIDTEISDLLYTLEKSCGALKLIHLADDTTTNALFEYLFKLIDFFKSAKADLTGYDLILSLAHNSENIMKLLASIDHIVEGTEIHSIFDELTDLISYYQETKRLEDDYLKLIDKMHSQEEAELWMNAVMKLDDRLVLVSEIISKLASDMTFVDELATKYSMSLPSDSLTMKDQVMLLRDRIVETVWHFIQDKFEMTDTLVSITKHSSMNDILEDPRKRENARYRMRRYADAPALSLDKAHTLTLQALLSLVTLTQSLDSDDSLSFTDQLSDSKDQMLIEFFIRLKDRMMDMTEKAQLPDENIHCGDILMDIMETVMTRKLGEMKLIDDLNISTSESYYHIIRLTSEIMDEVIQMILVDQVWIHDIIVKISQSEGASESTMHLIDNIDVNSSKYLGSSSMMMRDMLIIDKENPIQSSL